MTRACLHCQHHVQRPRRVAQAATSPGSRKRAPGVLRPQRGVTQSIPIDGLPETAWSAVDRGTARADSRPKSLRSVPEKGHCTLIAFAEKRRRREWDWLRAKTGFTTFFVATGLWPERNIPLHFPSGCQP